MKDGISFKQYRMIDLALFSLILLGSQFLTARAATVWYADQLYIVSPVAAITAIVMMRWGPYALIHALLGGAFHCLLLGGGTQQWIVYIAGNAAAMLLLLMLRHYGKEELRASVSRTLTFAALTQLLMLAGRALVALAAGLGPQAALSLITTDVLSVVFTMVVLWIARRINGLFEDQKHYLFRIQREEKDKPEQVGQHAGMTDEDDAGRGIQP